MPTFTRKQLRQRLGADYLGDTIVGTNTLIVASGVAAGAMDTILADPSLSGEQVYVRAMLRVASGDYRVASWNAASGAYVSQQLTIQPIASGADYELHQKLSANDKNRTIDDTVLRLRIRQEVAITATDNLTFYDISGAASPHSITDVLNVYYFVTPDGSLTRQENYLNDARLVMTASGQELRINPGLQGSQQIVLDAILTLTLQSGDAATINIPDERWLLAGASARCYGLMIQAAPGQQAGELRNRQMEWAAEFTRLSSRFAPNYERKIRLEIA